MKKEKQDLQVEAYNENNPSPHDLDIQSREEGLAAADNIDSVEDPIQLDENFDGREEHFDKKEDASADKEFLETSAEAVGFENREQQWDIYRVMSQYFSPDDSVLDFGCARGDFNSFYLSEYDATLNYTGIDFNKQLVEAGKKINPDYNLMHGDWMDTQESADWCINIGSNDLRYDANLKSSDKDYLLSTIKQMYNCCNSGLAIMLSSDILEQEDGLLTWSAGDLFNSILLDYRTASIDHSYSDAAFTLIIYKN